jgi:DNA-binding response OmpR family regulator
MKHTLLIVDDDKLITNTLEKRFSSFDFDVRTAQTAGQAKHILETFNPDAVILDLLLTTEDGSMVGSFLIKYLILIQRVNVLI